jgi:hypothetical protein
MASIVPGSRPRAAGGLLLAWLPRENGDSVIIKSGLRNFVISQMGFVRLPLSNKTRPLKCRALDLLPFFFAVPYFFPPFYP